jgi:hypothetical protein
MGAGWTQSASQAAVIVNKKDPNGNKEENMPQYMRESCVVALTEIRKLELICQAPDGNVFLMPVM